jgi:dihydroorotase
MDYARTEDAARTLAENADIAIGIKVRMSENVIAKNGLEPLKRAIKACEMSGVAGAKVMCHIGGVENRQLMSDILDTLRPRDILTHCYSGAPNLHDDFTNIVQDGKILPAALEAKRRGVHFDVGHGGGSFDYTIAEAAMAAGAMPDTISSDMHVFSGNTPGMPYLTWVMSKFLNMGFTLEQVVAMTTIAPSRAINKIAKLGTLQVGAPGDVTILEVVNGPVEFVDTRNNKRQGKVFIRPVQTINGGIAFGRPFSAPFSVR